MARLPSLIVFAFALLAGSVLAAPAPVRGGETFTMTRSSDGVYKVSPVSSGGLPVSRSITAGSVMMGAGAVGVLDTFTGQGPAGALAVNVNRSVDWDSVVGAAAAGLLATKSPWGAAAAGAYDLWNQLRVRPDGSGGAMRDVGVPPGEETGTQYRVPSCGNDWHTARSAASQACSVLIDPQTETGTCRYSFEGDHVTRCTVYYKGTSTIKHNDIILSTTMSQEVRVQPKPCSAYTDSVTGQQVPEGRPPGIDGKCSTGSYQAATANDLKTLVNSTPTIQAAAQQQSTVLAQDALNQGQSLTPQSQTISGPASQSGTPQTQTTVKPDGTTEVKTVTPTYNYTYEGDEVKIQTTNVTTTNNNGQTTTTTTTTNGTGGADVDICKSNPTASACAELGSGSVDPAPPQQVPFAINSVTMPDGSGCPAPVQWTAFNHAYQFSFTPMCDAATIWVRPVILVVSIALGAFVFIGGMKS